MLNKFQNFHLLSTVFSPAKLFATWRLCGNKPYSFLQLSNCTSFYVQSPISLRFSLNLTASLCETILMLLPSGPGWEGPERSEMKRKALAVLKLQVKGMEVQLLSSGNAIGLIATQSGCKKLSQRKHSTQLQLDSKQLGDLFQQWLANMERPLALPNELCTTYDKTLHAACLPTSCY